MNEIKHIKRLLIIAFLISGPISVKSQNVFYDAITLANKSNLSADGSFKSNEVVYTILSNYTTKLNPTNSDMDVEFDGSPGKNPFLIISSGPHDLTVFNTLQKTASNIGSLDVTNLADGLAKFIVKRTKQELSTAFFEQFKQDLDSTPEIQILFPATYNALKAIDQEIYNYSAYLNLLQESFKQDLVLILPDINKLINDSCMNLVFVHNQEIKIILSDALYLTTEFGQGKPPGEIIHNYLNSQAKSESLNKIDPSLYPSLQTLDLFSQSLRSKQSNKYWISSDSLNLLFDNPAFKIYLGLIYQKAKLSNHKIIFNGKEFTDYLKDSVTKTSPYKNFLTDLISKSGSVEYYFKALKEKQLAGKDKPTYQDYYSLYDASLNLLEYITITPAIINLPILNATDGTKLYNYFTSARSLGNIYVDIYEKQYSSAIVELSNLYSNLVSYQVQKEIAGTKIQIQDIKVRIRNANDSVRKSLENNINQLNLKNRQLESLKNTSSFILKYGTLAATIAKAESSDDVQASIEAIALPSGSSAIKRESKSNVSINAYCGISGGKNIAGEWSTGLTAPVGIAVSWGICRHSSFSLFLSVFDLGAPVAFRFSNSSDSVPAIKLADIISPGLFVSWGIPKCPVSINAGLQMTPALTSVSTKENTFGTKSLRVTVGACVDLPILNLYNKSK